MEAKNPQFDSPFWRLPTVLEFTSVSRSTWLDLVREGQAPSPRKFPGRRAVVWVADEVRQYMATLPAASVEVA